MDKNTLIEIVEKPEQKSNADLLKAIESLGIEFEQTKKTILDLTNHLDVVEKYYYKLSDELKKRTKK